MHINNNRFSGRLIHPIIYNFAWLFKINERNITFNKFNNHAAPSYEVITSIAVTPQHYAYIRWYECAVIIIYQSLHFRERRQKLWRVVTMFPNFRKTWRKLRRQLYISSIFPSDYTFRLLRLDSNFIFLGKNFSLLLALHKNRRARAK